jgi:hypothetical protein
VAEIKQNVFGIEPTEEVDQPVVAVKPKVGNPFGLIQADSPVTTGEIAERE